MVKINLKLIMINYL